MQLLFTSTSAWQAPSTPSLIQVISFIPCCFCNQARVQVPGSGFRGEKLHWQNPATNYEGFCSLRNSEFSNSLWSTIKLVIRKDGRSFHSLLGSLHRQWLLNHQKWELILVVTSMVWGVCGDYVKCCCCPWEEKSIFRSSNFAENDCWFNNRAGATANYKAAVGE